MKKTATKIGISRSLKSAPGFSLSNGTASNRFFERIAAKFGFVTGHGCFPDLLLLRQSTPSQRGDAHLVNQHIFKSYRSYSYHLNLFIKPVRTLNMMINHSDKGNGEDEPSPLELTGVIGSNNNIFNLSSTGGIDNFYQIADYSSPKLIFQKKDFHREKKEFPAMSRGRLFSLTQKAGALINYLNVTEAYVSRSRELPFQSAPAIGNVNHYLSSKRERLVDATSSARGKIVVGKVYEEKIKQIRGDSFNKSHEHSPSGHASGTLLVSNGRPVFYPLKSDGPLEKADHVKALFRRGNIGGTRPSSEGRAHFFRKEENNDRNKFLTFQKNFIERPANRKSLSSNKEWPYWTPSFRKEQNIKGKFSISAESGRTIKKDAFTRMEPLLPFGKRVEQVKERVHSVVDSRAFNGEGNVAKSIVSPHQKDSGGEKYQREVGPVSSSKKMGVLKDSFFTFQKSFFQRHEKLRDTITSPPEKVSGDEKSERGRGLVSYGRRRGILKDSFYTFQKSFFKKSENDSDAILLTRQRDIASSSDVRHIENFYRESAVKTSAYNRLDSVGSRQKMTIYDVAKWVNRFTQHAFPGIQPQGRQDRRLMRKLLHVDAWSRYLKGHSFNVYEDAEVRERIAPLERLLKGGRRREVTITRPTSFSRDSRGQIFYSDSSYPSLKVKESHIQPAQVTESEQVVVVNEPAVTETPHIEKKSETLKLENIDLDRITDKVYRALENRIRVEKEWRTSF